MGVNKSFDFDFSKFFVEWNLIVQKN